MGLPLLKRVGDDDDALDAVDALRSAMPDNLCMIFELDAATSAIKKRITTGK
jgi:hypothetical protein